MVTERIEIDGELCAVILSINERAATTEFYTDPSLLLQVGQIAINPERSIQRHRHNLIERKTFGTNEVLVILQGSLDMELYGSRESVKEKRTLLEGQVVILCGGGHAFESSENCLVLEIKNGPFVFDNDKEYF